MKKTTVKGPYSPFLESGILFLRSELLYFNFPVISILAIAGKLASAMVLFITSKPIFF